MMIGMIFLQNIYVWYMQIETSSISVPLPWRIENFCYSYSTFFVFFPSKAFLFFYNWCIITISSIFFKITIHPAKERRDDVVEMSFVCPTKLLVLFKWSTQRRLDGTSPRGLGSTKERREKLSRAYNNELPLVRLLNVSTSFKWNAQLGLGGTSPSHHSGTSPRCCAGVL